MLLTQERPERARRLAPVGFGQERPLLAPGELAASPDREHLRVPVRCARGRLCSRPTGSFRERLGGGTRGSIHGIVRR